MILAIWALIAVVVIISALLIYIEHEWGLVLGGLTSVILVVSYFSVELLMRTPLVVLLPASSSPLDAMTMTAGVLLVVALVGIAYLAGRSRIGEVPPIKRAAAKVTADAVVPLEVMRRLRRWMRRKIGG
ncbi:hypothetical protein [Hyphomicrobium sp. CS1BSMeth3]|uniref:hypothetical protein n=1 Tax=Hyphomicrobium sp. CS1BSMeth3 TaxID=1892844 RepID=UPI0015775D9D|nr:hypothetical protein [Hyphomicrobium sp. CS1BSMeth3]